MRLFWGGEPGAYNIKTSFVSFCVNFAVGSIKKYNKVL